MIWSPLERAFNIIFWEFICKYIGLVADINGLEKPTLNVVSITKNREATPLGNEGLVTLLKATALARLQDPASLESRVAISGGVNTLIQDSSVLLVARKDSNRLEVSKLTATSDFH
jgi:hypothetical protein